MTEFQFRKETEIVSKVSNLAKSADKSPVDSHLDSEEVERAKLETEFRRHAVEVKRLFESPDSNSTTARVIEAVAKEYGVRPLEILKWVGVEIKMPIWDEGGIVKYGTTNETKILVWTMFQSSGEIPPTEKEFMEAVPHYEDADFRSVCNNPLQLITRIMNYRQGLVNDVERRQKAGLHVKEYINDQDLLQRFAGIFSKSTEIIRDAIFKVFQKKFDREELSGWDLIKMDEMEGLLREYFQ